MKRLDHGHLHPELEIPKLTCPGRALNPTSPSACGYMNIHERTRDALGCRPNSCMCQGVLT
jgi:hypothetical protein